MTTYNRCLVKTCKNNTRKTPAKIFVPVPMIPEQREVWFRLAHRDMSQFSITSRHHFCEDHFDLPNEMANFKSYKKNCGQKVIIIKGCLPRFLLPVEEKEPEQFTLQRTSNMKTYHKKNDNNISQENVHEYKKKEKVESLSIPTSITEEPENVGLVSIESKEEDLKIENHSKKESVEYNLSLQKKMVPNDQRSLEAVLKAETKHESYIKTETATKKGENKCVIVASNRDKEILSDQGKNTSLNEPLACKKTRKNKNPHKSSTKTDDSMSAKSKIDILENTQSNIEASSNTIKRKSKIDDCEDTRNKKKNFSDSKVNININTDAHVETKSKTIASKNINNKAKASKSNLKALETTSDIKVHTKNNNSSNITKTSKLLANDPYYQQCLAGAIFHKTSQQHENRIKYIENDTNYLCDKINPIQYDDDYLYHVKALAKVSGEYHSNDKSCDFNSISNVGQKRSYDDSYEPYASSEPKSKCKESSRLAYISRVTKESDKGLTDTKNNSNDEEMERIKLSQFLKERPDFVVIQVLDENLSGNDDEHKVTALIKEDVDGLPSNVLNIKVETELNDQVLDKDLRINDDEHTVTAPIKEEDLEGLASNVLKIKVEIELNDQVLDEDLRINDDEHNVTAPIKKEDLEGLASNVLNIKAKTEFNVPIVYKVEVTETEHARQPSIENIEAILRAMIPPVFHTFNWHMDGEASEESFEKIFRGNSRNIVLGETRPIDIFLQIWDEELMAKIVKLINTRIAALHMSATWRFIRPTDVNELYVLLASVLAPAKQFLKDTMTSHRFRDLMCLQIFSDNVKFEKKTLNYKMQNEIHSIVKHLNQNFQTLYNPQCHLCVEKMFIDNECAIEGKTTAYTLCDLLSSYTLNITIDNVSSNIIDSSSVLEKENNTPQDMCTKSTRISPGEIILNLISPYLHKGHTIVTDSNFSCPLLARYLKFNQTDFFGSLDEVPENLKNKELGVGEVLTASSGDLKFMLWNNAEKPVKLLSTYHDLNDNSVTEETPQEVREYELMWSATIARNMLLSRFPSESLKNIDYDKLLIWLLNVSVVNTYIIYKQTHKNTTYCEKFWFRLAEELVEYTKIDVKQSVVDGRLRPIVRSNHYIVKNETSEKHICEYCSRIKKKSRTNWKCDMCNVPLCLECLKPYHATDKILGRLVSSSKAYRVFVDELDKRKEQDQQHVSRLFT